MGRTQPAQPKTVRGRIRGRGLIERITVRPRSSAPRFTADVYGLGPVRLVWIGQRIVPGIDAGVELTFEGMASQVEGHTTIYNPRYEIIGRPEASA